MNDRHHCSVRGSTSSLSVIVSPVPVNPLMLSNSALIGLVKAASVEDWAGAPSAAGPASTVHAIR